MTVKELREQLSHYPDDIKVMWSYAEEVNLVVEKIVSKNTFKYFREKKDEIIF